MSSCTRVRPLLDELIDGTATDEQRATVVAHLERCEHCRREAEELRELVGRARALGEDHVVPVRDLWPGVERRLFRPRVVPSMVMVAAAAVVAAATGALIAVLALQQLPGSPAVDQHANAPGPISASAVQLAAGDASVSEAQGDLERVRNELMAVIDDRRQTMSPETAAMIDDNLRIIDAALVQIRSALEADPANTELRHLFVATYRKEIDFLQRMARFSADGTA